jgi:16S rRNA (cytosine1402-N4)-methyltransferase
MHVPIMVSEVLDALSLRSGALVVDGTLGFGGHAREILPFTQPGGRLIGLDVDPVELARTAERLRGLGFSEEILAIRRSNFAGLPAILAAGGFPGADGIFVDLGASSMQIDTPERGFSFKIPGPLDMRMNPSRGQPAAAFVENIRPVALEALLRDYSDEPAAPSLAAALAGRHFSQTTDLAAAVRNTLPHHDENALARSIRRVFQAIRIAVNEEMSALDTFLRVVPECLVPGGRVVILTFHSGEDRRVKKAFQAGVRDGRYSKIADDITRATPAECHRNPRATSAKLRWAQR